MHEQLLLTPGNNGEHSGGMDRPLTAESGNREREIQRGILKFKTNLPPGIEIFDHDSIEATGRLPGTLQPPSLDELEVGDYWISRKYLDSFDGDEVEREERQVIEIIDSPNGKVVSTSSFSSNGWSYIQDRNPKLMESIGYVVGEGDGGFLRFVAAPTPETLKAAAKKQGVEVEFFPDQEYIQGRDYLGAFSEAKYPVSTKTELQYEHDISDDHITAMVLGGEKLRDALKDVASGVLAEGSKDLIDAAASEIDIFTATLRGIISSNTAISGEAYGKQRGRLTYLRAADRLGISTEKAEEILADAQAKGRDFGLKVKELD